MRILVYQLESPWNGNRLCTLYTDGCQPYIKRNKLCNLWHDRLELSLYLVKLPVK